MSVELTFLDAGDEVGWRDKKIKVRRAGWYLVTEEGPGTSRLREAWGMDPRHSGTVHVTLVRPA